MSEASSLNAHRGVPNGIQVLDRPRVLMLHRKHAAIPKRPFRVSLAQPTCTVLPVVVALAVDVTPLKKSGDTKTKGVSPCLRTKNRRCLLYTSDAADE